MAKRKLTIRQIERAIKGSNGLISTIAQRLSVCRQTVSEYLKKYPELNKPLLEETESVLDVVESKLMKKVQEEESWAIKFYLQNKGKNRGYGICTVSVKDKEEETIDGIYREVIRASNVELKEMIDE